MEQVGGASAMGRGLQPMVEVTEEVMEEYQYDMDEDFQVTLIFYFLSLWGSYKANWSAIPVALLPRTMRKILMKSLRAVTVRRGRPRPQEATLTQEGWTW